MDDLVIGGIVLGRIGGEECGSGTMRYVWVGVKNSRHGKRKAGGGGMVGVVAVKLLKTYSQTARSFIKGSSTHWPPMTHQDDLCFVRTVLVITHSFPHNPHSLLSTFPLMDCFFSRPIRPPVAHIQLSYPMSQHLCHLLGQTWSVRIPVVYKD